VRIGFITQLLWERYGTFWLELLRSMEVELLFPAPEEVLKKLEDNRLEPIPGLAFRLAAAQALALQDADLIMTPDLNLNQDIPRGGGQDPWIASFPEALATTVGGLPILFSVPASLEPDLEPLAFKLLLWLNRDAAKARRVWERHRELAKPAPFYEPRWTKLSGDKETIGVIGQPWLFTKALLQQLQVEGLQLISQSWFDPQLLRAEGRRADTRLVDTDTEVLGAARYLARRGSIDRLVFILDEGSGADVWLEQRVRRLVHKPLEVYPIQNLPKTTLLDTSLGKS
jgi:hypothetical protein